MSDQKPYFTPPFDARFPNQNQSRNCYQNFLDYHRCKDKFGDDHQPCNYFKQVYAQLCPNEWIEKWNDQIADGKFAGKIKSS